VLATEQVVERATARSWIRIAALALGALAAVLFLVRVPFAIVKIDHRASFNGRQSSLSRTIQGADGLAIDNTFAEQALALLPARAPYTVALPQSQQVADQYHISPTTMNALPLYMQFLLLPRREVDAAQARYVLCYACNTDPFDKRGMKRLWTDPKGYVIGELPP